MTQTKPFTIPKRMVWVAFKTVRAKRGAPGVDGQGTEDFERDLRRNLYRLWNRMSSGSYHPPPVMRVEIPKRDGGVRVLGIPTVEDRIAQAVVKMYLEPFVEPVFHPDSFGYRPGRSAHDAVESARSRCWKHGWVLDLDIRSFFDRLDHELVLRAVRRFTDCRWVLLYIKRWLKADLQDQEGQVVTRDRGTPQGGVISPLLANIFLHLAFDQWMLETFPGVPFERYADDILVHCQSKGQAEWMLQRIQERLERCRLELHPGKTRIVGCKPGTWSRSEVRSFDFLGFTFQPRLAKARTGQIFVSFSPAISGKAARRVRQTMRRSWRLPRRTRMTLEELAAFINPVLRGWIRYYGRFRPSALVSVLRGLNVALRQWVMRKYKRFRRRPKKAMAWLQRIAERTPGLFVHWEIAGLLPTVTAGR
ncbi:group II intron reverse transcriptase/maturase [Enhygromyxa salina]|uniref:RNA-directed DNA polymerase n=1 Tax=Enhygromyxa salina TaxID=215803 RepID=A0A2S9YWW8_9BACT|nr:group II intron reverse transcriptase/maturase [Enhygromyxa salina]PRQ09549.1 Group II intron-encoded protein LtrA [Enhygromyxa salina]